MERVSKPNVINDLEREWPALARSSRAVRAVTDWSTREPALAGLRTLDEVVRVILDEENARSVATMQALVRVAGEDALARRAVLQVMIPVMARRVRGVRSRMHAAGLRCDADEAAQLVVTAMVDVIARVSGRTLEWPISVLRSKLRRRLFASLDRQEERARLELPLGPLALVREESTAWGELRDVLDRATRLGFITERDCTLVWFTRVLGWDARELTGYFGGTHRTLLKRRERAERALAAMGRAA